MDTKATRRPAAAGRIRGVIARLEARIDRQREMLWQPRLELVLAREIAHGQRHLEALRRRRF
jgi:hypothetical protein